MAVTPNVATYYVDPFPTQLTVPVKTEESSSPDLSPSSHSLSHYPFKFRAQLSPTHASLIQSRTQSESPSGSLLSSGTTLYRFGSDNGSTSSLPSEHAWPPPTHPLSSTTTQQYIPPPLNTHTTNGTQYLHPPNMSYSDEYDVSDLAEYGGHHSQEKQVRRRSSKACDQCRKSKCKCERSSPNEPCKSCIMLSTPCTFLGPSRKRGPPKGYIDAIEARLHQTEALVGIMLATKDPRAQSLLKDIGKLDPVAQEIINRVDKSPYGVKGRRDANGNAKLRTTNSTTSLRTDANGKLDLTSTHPSNEWQDTVIGKLDAAAGFDTQPPPIPKEAQDVSGDADESNSDALSVAALSPEGVGSPRAPSQASDGLHSPGRRQRRRVGDHDFSPTQLQSPSLKRASLGSPTAASVPNSSRGRARGQTYSSLSPVHPPNKERRSSTPDSISSDSEDELTGAVGQLSLNENEQVRYHGKLSGLHILNGKERNDGRNEGGIWRLPSARVWPPAPDGPNLLQDDEQQVAHHLPDKATQTRLIDLFFRYVHPAFPVVHKRSFFDAYEKSHSQSSERDGGINRRPRRISMLLLLTIFAIAARYDGVPPPADQSLMWSAGDEYLETAKVLLDRSYASSRLTTCQALLLIGYREVGIGAMAEAWTYIGMAIRMAQDLGMHRSADGWARVGARIFSDDELQERKRIWYGCVILDKYISTYIGRPLMIFERDFDTPLPNENDPEEYEKWSSDDLSEHAVPVPSYKISCFNASSTLSSIVSTIVQAIYAVRPVSSRQAEAKVLEGLLDKWYFELPSHLQYDPNNSSAKTPVPHILTLHMQYWCAVLLLHRPFIRSGKGRSDDGEDAEMTATASKHYELCAGAANRITAIINVYTQHYPLERSSVFLCYYLFTAALMHFTTLTTYPADPQGQLGLKRCMDALGMMGSVWPSAQRAFHLLGGAKVNLQGAEFVTSSSSVTRQKRSAESTLDDRDPPKRLSPINTNVHSSYTVPSRPESLASNYLYPSMVQGVSSTTSSHHHAPAPSVISPLPGPAPAAYRWNPEDFVHSSPFPNPAPLSTSVLPQVYSTGFSDERLMSAHTQQRIAPASQSNHHTHIAQNRYPQYWNDYSAFPQLGQAYPVMHQSDQNPANGQMNSQMYHQDQYSLYGQPFPER